MGLLIGARLAKQTVILSGGSQMIAIILLVLEFLGEKNKDEFIEDVFIATTGSVSYTHLTLPTKVTV